MPQTVNKNLAVICGLICYGQKSLIPLVTGIFLAVKIHQSYKITFGLQKLDPKGRIAPGQDLDLEHTRMNRGPDLSEAVLFSPNPYYGQAMMSTRMFPLTNLLLMS